MQLKPSNYNLITEYNGGYFLNNLLSKSSIFVEPKNFFYLKENFLKNTSYNNKYGKVYDFLIGNGFLINKDLDEYREILLKFNKKRINTSSLSLLITPTLDCNMSCFYCYQGKKNKQSLQTEDIVKITNFIEKRKEGVNNLNITWFGGEPLLTKEFISLSTAKFIELCKKNNINYKAGIVTNGFFLNESTINDLINFKVSRVQITLDGSRSAHDKVRSNKLNPSKLGTNSFDIILNNIHMASEHLEVFIRVNVSEKNIHTIDTLIEQLYEKNIHSCIKGIYFYPIFNFKNTKKKSNYLGSEHIYLNIENFSKYETHYIEKSFKLGFKVMDPFERNFNACSALKKNSFSIDSSGNVMKCDNDIGLSNKSFTSIYSNFNNDEQLIKWDNYKPNNYLSCKKCTFFPICYSNCPHRNMLLNDKKPICPSYKYNWKQTFPIYLQQRQQTILKTT